MAVVGIAMLLLSCGDGAVEPAPPPAPVATTVTVSPASATLTALGETVRFTAEVRDQNGQVMAGAAVTWASSDASVAAVDASGLVTAAGNGTATINATAGSASGTATVTIAVENPDRAALETLYNATDGPNWINNENWLTDTPLAEWYGVRTNGSGRVVSLDLAGEWDFEKRESIRHGLNGPIPLELGRLTALRTLDLSRNALSGPMPPELGNLVALESLAFDDNALSGSIPPELGNLVALESLNLDGNDLSGPIPPETGDLAALESLSLLNNALSGPIPPEIGNLATLRHLQLRGNGLVGPIPPEIGNLAALDYMDFDGNDLSGPIPPEIGNLARLDNLSLGGNNLSGTIPWEIGNLIRLETLWFGGNPRLSGALPTSMLALDLREFAILGTGLCVPVDPAFQTWLASIRYLHDRDIDLCGSSDRAALEALYHATGGPDWLQDANWLTDAPLRDWHGVSTDPAGWVNGLDLARNGLEGQLPSGLGTLTHLNVLRIGHNASLSGRLPLNLVQLPLRDFSYGETQLCVPKATTFQAWIAGIQSHEGTGVECGPLPEREALEALYHASGGRGWLEADNWLTDAPLRDWHGVTVDARGAVVHLDLARNGLSGPIPPELGSLAALEHLDVRWNGLSGPIPPELGNLPALERLQLSGNAFSGQIPPELGNLAALRYLKLGNNSLTGPIPVEFGNLATLEYLELSLNHLTEIPPELGNLPALEQLILSGNAFTGQIPPELASLSALEYLSLGACKGINGTIPSEFGNLGSLKELVLVGNDLRGPIPPELGNLTELELLDLRDNDLSGPIPPDLGNLASLASLRLSGNDLTGPIPPQLGDLAGIEQIVLADNALTGPIPPELGNLTGLEQLYLNNNRLAGPIPPEFGGMVALRNLYLSNNSGLRGTLPVNLLGLHQLEVLLAGGTSLCAPADAPFQAWLNRIDQSRIVSCDPPPAAYLVQSVQSLDFPVALVAGTDALLRVFVTAERATSETIPEIRARFYQDDRETHVEHIPASSVPIPTEVSQGALSKSANATIPGSVLQPGLEMVIEIDPAGTLDASLGVAKRIPETGRLAVEVHAVPPFDLTLVPFVWTEEPDRSIIGIVAGMAADPEGHELLTATRRLLPVRGLEVTAHEPVLSSTNNTRGVLAETWAIRAMEGGAGHYMGMMQGEVTGGRGVAYTPGRASFSTPDGVVIAHELGHNMSLLHAPCVAIDRLDDGFPYTNGGIGAWGYNFATNRVVEPHTPDLMSYCRPPWVSDYSFTKALHFRLEDEATRTSAVAAQPARALLLWGGVDSTGVPYLEPAFIVEAEPALPASGGDYRITGRTEGGDEVFSLAFDMLQVADGAGDSQGFGFALPVQPGWAGNLASITLTGPGGSATLDKETDQPMTILRNPQTGQVRGFLRNLGSPTQAAMDAVGGAAGPGLEMLFSRGVPDEEAWRR